MSIDILKLLSYMNPNFYVFQTLYRTLNKNREIFIAW